MNMSKINRITIMRLGTSNFGKIGTYNVQEVGLAEALIKKGFHVNVLYLNRPTDMVLQDETYAYVYYLPHKHIGLHGIFDVRLLDKFNPDFLIMFSDSQLWSKNVIEWCERKKIKCVHYFGNVLSDNPKRLHQFYTKLILMRNRSSYKKSINIAKTKKVKTELESHNIRCSAVVNVGLDESILRPEVNLDIEIRKSLGYSLEDTVLLFVGRLVDYKKPLMACDIMKKMRSNGINARLIIIGKGSQEELLKAYIYKEELTEYVNCVGRVPYEDMYKYFVASDCIINLSHKEIFGMTILEAMYYSIPVVAHTAPGPNDIIEDKKTGYLIDSDDLNVWCNAIKSAIENRIELGTASRKCITDNYMWDKIAEQFCELVGV